MPNLTTRAKAAFKPSTFNEKQKSVRVVAATENPVPVFDYERYEVVPEILLMSGLSLPESGQMPLLDTHSRYSVENVLGSARNFTVKGAELEAEVFFSGDQAGQDTAGKIRDGHLTDFSIGYRVTESYWVPEGEKQIIEGRTFEGPVRVSTKWELRELSIAAIGADKNAKARSADYKEEKTMEKEREAEIRREERARVSEISGMCAKFNCEPLGRSMVESGASIDEARKTVMAHLERTNSDPRLPIHPAGFDIGLTDTEKRTAAIIDGLVMRSGIQIEKPAAGAEDFRGCSLVDVARESLLMAGIRPTGRGAAQIVKDALSVRSHTTSDFPYLLANVANKTLRRAYETAPGTFEPWTVFSSGVDFKEMSRPQISEGPDLKEVPENTEYKYGTMGESKEVFKITTKGLLFSISRQAIINDDLAAFTRIPRAFSMSAKRGLNADVYAVLTANAAMGDGKALFHADHGNFVDNGAGAAPGIDTLSAGRLAMRTQTGLNGAVLNIAPRFLIVPAALETQGDAVLNTIEGYDAADGPGVRNSFYKKLILVVEPILDATDPAAWYLAADPGQFDTVEICYLGGQRQPYIETKDGWTVDGLEYKIRFEFGVKALDHRGLYKNDGN